MCVLYENHNDVWLYKQELPESKYLEYDKTNQIHDDIKNQMYNVLKKVASNTPIININNKVIIARNNSHNFNNRSTAPG